MIVIGNINISLLKEYNIIYMSCLFAYKILLAPFGNKIIRVQRTVTRNGPSDKTKKFGRLVEPKSIANSLLGPTSKVHPPALLIWQYLYVQLLLRFLKA
jgi:hypothetical protein